MKVMLCLQQLRDPIAPRCRRNLRFTYHIPCCWCRNSSRLQHQICHRLVFA